MQAYRTADTATAEISTESTDLRWAVLYRALVTQTQSVEAIRTTACIVSAVSSSKNFRYRSYY